MFPYLARNIIFCSSQRLLSTHTTCAGGALIQKIISNTQYNESNVQLRKLNTSNSKCNESSITQKITQELSIFKTVDFSELKSAPFPAIVYGFGGVVPFVFPPLYFIVSSFSPLLATTQLMYGATILAFIGGVRWGNALAKNEISHNQIGKSVIPSLVAWSGLLVPEPLGFLVVSSGLVGALYVDLTSSKYPPWFCAMRCSLTGIAVTSLMTTMFVYIFN